MWKIAHQNLWSVRSGTSFSWEDQQRLCRQAKAGSPIVDAAGGKHPTVSRLEEYVESKSTLLSLQILNQMEDESALLMAAAALCLLDELAKAFCCKISSNASRFWTERCLALLGSPLPSKSAWHCKHRGKTPIDSLRKYMIGNWCC